MMQESVDDRILGALRFIDAESGVPMNIPLAVGLAAGKPGTKFVQNLRGVYVVMASPGFEAYGAAFGTPPAVSTATLDVLVSDPAGAYVARRCSVAIPSGTVLDVPLYPSPNARTAPGSAIVRASVTDVADGAGLGGALLRVRLKDQDQVLARGLTDARGEALVPVPGVPVTSWNGSGGSVLSTQIDVTVEVAFDPAAKGVAGYVPDPGDLETRFGTLPSAASDTQLTSRKKVYVALAVSLS